MTMSKRHKLILAQIEETTKRGMKSRKAARTILIDEGIYTPKGNLKKEFGGRGAARSAADRAA